MLILTRRDGQEIVIGSGDNVIRVVVSNISGTRVQLSIEAPPEIKIRRGELDLAAE